MDKDVKIPKRVLGTLLNSVGAGVVPRFGLEYMAIGRAEEIKAIAGDLDFVLEGGAAFRFIIGRYGSGKSFLLQLIRNHCLERGFVTADADLSPERRLSGTKGQGLSVYRELVANLATRSSPDGNALVQIITKWLSALQTQVITESKCSPGTPEFENAMTAQILGLSQSLENLVCGFDFAGVVHKYYTAYRTGNEDLKSAALKWLRGEFNTKTEARAALGVGTVIDDLNWYDFIKLIAVFVRRMNYKGLVIFIDECVNLYKITNKISRENNYEKILSMFNDTMQGKAEGLGIFMGGTPQFLEDTRRGLYSYEALKSRLQESRFLSGRFKNLMGPVIRIERMSDEEIFALTLRIYTLHANYHSYEKTLSDNDILQFLKTYLAKVGSSTLVTPREIIRDLLGILDILCQNSETSFEEIIRREERNFNSKGSGESDDNLSVEDKSEVAETESKPDDGENAFKMNFNDLDI